MRGGAIPETFFLPVDKQSFESLDDAARTELVSTHLRTVALSKQMSIQTLIVSYSFAEDVSALLARHNYGNTVVEATLPYCLHLPDGHKTIVKLSDDRAVRILLEKVWTDRAEGSDTTDVFHDAKVTYFQKSEYRTPEVPRDPKLGTSPARTILSALAKQNLGFYLIGSSTGIGSAVMNRSRREIEQIDSIVKHGERPPVFELLRLSAQASLKTRSLTLAIVQSFQALELAIERFIFKGYVSHGMAEADVNAILDAKWRTKERLRDVVPDMTGVSPNTQAFWDRWCGVYDRTRNEVIHEGREPTATEATETLKVNDEVIEWMKTLPVRISSRS